MTDQQSPQPAESKAANARRASSASRKATGSVARVRSKKDALSGSEADPSDASLDEPKAGGQNPADFENDELTPVIDLSQPEARSSEQPAASDGAPESQLVEQDEQAAVIELVAVPVEASTQAATAAAASDDHLEDDGQGGQTPELGAAELEGAKLGTAAAEGFEAGAAQQGSSSQAPGQAGFSPQAEQAASSWGEQPGSQGDAGSQPAHSQPSPSYDSSCGAAPNGSSAAPAAGTQPRKPSVHSEQPISPLDAAAAARKGGHTLRRDIPSTSGRSSASGKSAAATSSDAAEAEEASAKQASAGEPKKSSRRAAAKQSFASQSTPEQTAAEAPKAKGQTAMDQTTATEQAGADQSSVAEKPAESQAASGKKFPFFAGKRKKGQQTAEEPLPEGVPADEAAVEEAAVEEAGKEETAEIHGAESPSWGTGAQTAAEPQNKGEAIFDEASDLDGASLAGFPTEEENVAEAAAPAQEAAQPESAAFAATYVPRDGSAMRESPAEQGAATDRAEASPLEKAAFGEDAFQTAAKQAAADGSRIQEQEEQEQASAAEAAMTAEPGQTGAEPAADAAADAVAKTGEAGNGGQNPKAAGEEGSKRKRGHRRSSRRAAKQESLQGESPTEGAEAQQSAPAAHAESAVDKGGENGAGEAGGEAANAAAPATETEAEGEAPTGSKEKKTHGLRGRRASKRKGAAAEGAEEAPEQEQASPAEAAGVAGVAAAAEAASEPASADADADADKKSRRHRGRRASKRKGAAAEGEEQAESSAEPTAAAAAAAVAAEGVASQLEVEEIDWTPSRPLPLPSGTWRDRPGARRINKAIYRRSLRKIEKEANPKPEKESEPNAAVKLVSDWGHRLRNAAADRSFSKQGAEYESGLGKRDFVWNTIGTACFGTLFPILTVVVTQLSGVEQAGMFSLAFTVGSLLLIVANFGMRPYQVSDLNEEHFFSDYQVHRILTCLIMILAGVLYSLVRGYTGLMLYISFGVYGFKMVEGLADVYEGRLQQQDKLYLAGISQTIRSVSTLVVFSLVLLISQSLAAACVAMPITALATFLLVTFPLAKFETPKSEKFKWSHVVDLFKQCSPLFLSLFLYTLIDYMPVFVIESVLSYDNELYYNAMYFPAQAIAVGMSVVYKPLLLRLANIWADRSQRRRFDMITIGMIALIALATGLVVALMLWVGIDIMSFFYGVDFSEFRGLVVIFLIAGGVTSVIDFLYQIITVLRRQQNIIQTYLISFGFSLFVPALLVNFTGLPGAVIGYLIVMCILLVLTASEYVRVRMEMSQEEDRLQSQQATQAAQAAKAAKAPYFAQTRAMHTAQSAGTSYLIVRQQQQDQEKTRQAAGGATGTTSAANAASMAKSTGSGGATSTGGGGAGGSAGSTGPTSTAAGSTSTGSAAASGGAAEDTSLAKRQRQPLSKK